MRLDSERHAPRPHRTARQTCGLARRLALTAGAFLAPVAGARLIEMRSFERMQLLETTSETSASVSLGDIDRDGDLDIILAKGRHWPLRNLVMRNDGRATFTTEAIGDSADRTYTAALADLNGDGTLDLVVSNDRPDKKRIYLSDATGHYRDAGTFGQSEWSGAAIPPVRDPASCA
jgi:FG-GAP-like repeat